MRDRYRVLQEKYELISEVVNPDWYYFFIGTTYGTNDEYIFGKLDKIHPYIYKAFFKDVDDENLWNNIDNVYYEFHSEGFIIGKSPDEKLLHNLFNALVKYSNATGKDFPGYFDEWRQRQEILKKGKEQHGLDLTFEGRETIIGKHNLPGEDLKSRYILTLLMPFTAYNLDSRVETDTYYDFSPGQKFRVYKTDYNDNSGDYYYYCYITPYKAITFDDPTEEGVLYTVQNLDALKALKKGKQQHGLDLTFEARKSAFSIKPYTDRFDHQDEFIVWLRHKMGSNDRDIYLQIRNDVVENWDEEDTLDDVETSFERWLDWYYEQFLDYKKIQDVLNKDKDKHGLDLTF